MEIIVADKSDDRLHVKLAGRMDTEGVATVRDRFTQMVGDSGTDTILDISMVDFMASVGMRMLLDNARRLAKAKRRLVLVGARGMVGESLRIARIGEVIPSVETVEEAAAKLG